MGTSKEITVLGILGGGQLGRMSAMAAAQLGIKTIIFCPETNSPASHVSAETINATYNDKDALKDFADKVDYISYEFENIPVETIDYLEALKPSLIFPKKKLLEVSQDRTIEKQFLNDSGVKTARWAPVSSLSDIENTLKGWNTKGFILKTTRFGYDGKGQIKCDDIHDDGLAGFLERTKDHQLIIEELVNFTCEISVVIARDKDGKTSCYGPMLNEHKNHILHTTTVPANVADETTEQAINIAQAVAKSVDLRGVLTVEFFVLGDGSVLANEIAPRTHNSGHWTLDACAVSQFENHVRTVCGLPVGSSERHSDAVMLNLIGDDIEKVQEHLHEPQTCVHLYGKREARKGRKMGHINFLKPKTNS